MLACSGESQALRLRSLPSAEQALSFGLLRRKYSLAEQLRIVETADAAKLEEGQELWPAS